MADDLVTWLRAQLDDDEQSIRTWGSACVHIDACDETGDFMERFDGDRLLAEVDAKRRIVELYDVSTSRELKPDAWELMKHAVRALALPYADRPGFRDEWRP